MWLRVQHGRRKCKIGQPYRKCPNRFVWFKLNRCIVTVLCVLKSNKDVSSRTELFLRFSSTTSDSGAPQGRFFWAFPRDFHQSCYHSLSVRTSWRSRRSPTYFRISQLTFACSRLRFARVWVVCVPEGDGLALALSINNKQRHSSRVRFCIPSWPCRLGDRGAEARKRAEWAWCSWSTGWLQV